MDSLFLAWQRVSADGVQLHPQQLRTGCLGRDGLALWW